MPRYDHAPIGNTCPDIDRIIGVIEAVSDRLDQLAGQLEDVDVSDNLVTQAENLRELFQTQRSPMEELRKANDSLRSWGNDEYNRAETAEGDVTSLQRTINELENL